MNKPFSPSCDRNRDPILDLLRVHFAQCRQVLEIGSGTGQHAVHFAAAMPWLTWQCSDRPEHLPGIRMWLDEAGLSNTPPPMELDVRAPGALATRRFDAVFSANTLHIMSWEEVVAFFDCVDALVGKRGGANRLIPGSSPGLALSSSKDVLEEQAVLVVYGPFNHGGAFTSASNRDFDAALRSREPHMGIRDLEAVDTLARGISMRLEHDLAMPANNRCLVWRR
ncbi:MAG: class I SAM-dependent methyltransferase [Lysobacter sp.]|nr:class I SAM-dependent methyltransferase [Lysobacter sp.]